MNTQRLFAVCETPLLLLALTMLVPVIVLFGLSAEGIPDRDVAERPAVLQILRIEH
jgi:hypothetical protein